MGMKSSGDVSRTYRFRRVKNGFDEQEVLDYIESLSEKNRELAARFEHIDSITRLAEKTVIEADRTMAEAQGIREEAERTAAQAVDDAKAEADRLVTEASKQIEDEVERVLSEAQQKADAVFQEKTTQAQEQAASIVAEAEQQAAGELNTVRVEGRHIREEATRAAAQAADDAKAEAERLVTEGKKQAEDEAEEIRTSAHQRADAVLRQKTLEAEEHARSLVSGAEQEAAALASDTEERATALISEAEQRARSIVTDAEEKARLAEEETKTLLKETEEKAAAMEQAARDDSEKVMAEARQEADDLRKSTLTQAEQEARDIIRDVTGKAKAQAAEIRREAEDILHRTKQSEAHVIDRLRKAYEFLLSDMEELVPHTSPAPQEAEAMTEQPGDLQAEDTICESEVPPVEDQVVEQADGAVATETEVTAEKTDEALYTGMVELTLPPPVALDRMMRLHKHLKQVPEIKVLKMSVSEEKALTIILFLEKSAPLLKILGDMPEIEAASEEPVKAHHGSRQEKETVTRIMVSTSN